MPDFRTWGNMSGTRWGATDPERWGRTGTTGLTTTRQFQAPADTLVHGQNDTLPLQKQEIREDKAALRRFQGGRKK